MIQQTVFKKMYLYAYVYKNNEKGVIIFKESKEGYLGRFRRKKWKGEIM